MFSKRNIVFAVVVVSLAAAVASLVRAESSSTSVDPQSSPVALRTESVSSFSEDLKAGQEALKAGHWEVARLHLMKVVGADPTNTDALKALAKTEVARAADFSTRDEHIMAAKVLHEARSALEIVETGLNGSPKSITGFPVLVEVDHILSHAESELRMDAERKSSIHVQEAGKLGDQAHHSWSFNDRNKVREALSNLHYVFERYALVGNWLQADYEREIAREKGLVADKEWAELLASSGFTHPETKN